MEEDKIDDRAKEEIGYYSGVLQSLVEQRNDCVKKIKEIDERIENYKKKLADLGVKAELEDKSE